MPPTKRKKHTVHRHPYAVRAAVIAGLLDDLIADINATPRKMDAKLRRATSNTIRLNRAQELLSHARRNVEPAMVLLMEMDP